MNLVHLKTKIFRLSVSCTLNKLAAFVCFGATMHSVNSRIAIVSGTAKGIGAPISKKLARADHFCSEGAGSFTGQTLHVYGGAAS